MSDQGSNKCATAIKILNIVTSLVIIGFGIAGIIFQAVSDLLAFKFFLFFSPVFMTIFGLIMFAAECNIQCLMNHLTFLNSLIGRGIFNIYMASTVYYYFACGTNGSDVAGWILASILFALGITYFILYCCGGQGATRDVKEQMM